MNTALTNTLLLILSHAKHSFGFTLLNPGCGWQRCIHPASYSLLLTQIRSQTAWALLSPVINIRGTSGKRKAGG